MTMATGGRRMVDKADVARRKDMAVRLRTLMEQQGLSVAELANKVQVELAGEKFNPVNLSHYRAGRSLPRPRYLNALSRVFGVASDELLPPKVITGSDGADAAEGPAPAFLIEDLADGQAWLQINQRLPWPLVLRILEALKGEKH